jgi:prolyl 4-hydroxylase
LSKPSNEYGGPPSPALAEIGARVDARLEQTPGVLKVPVHGLTLFVRENFLSAADCGFLIGLIDACVRPSTLFLDGNDSAFRTSSSGDLDRWDPGVSAIDARICALLGIPVSHGETMQGQRYEPGQQFKPHHDFFHVSQTYWPEQKRYGGQRSWTAMIYLNQPEAGGETQFPSAGATVAPRTGMLMAWNNMGADGAPNLESLHAGLPVTTGVKHIVTKWFRERPWVSEAV